MDLIMASSSPASILPKPFKSNYSDASSPRHPSQATAMTVTTAKTEPTVSSYETANKATKHLMAELNRRTSQRKRAKVGGCHVDTVIREYIASKNLGFFSPQKPGNRIYYEFISRQCIVRELKMPVLKTAIYISSATGRQISDLTSFRKKMIWSDCATWGLLNDSAQAVSLTDRT